MSLYTTLVDPGHSGGWETGSSGGLELERGHGTVQHWGAQACVPQLDGFSLATG